MGFGDRLAESSGEDPGSIGHPARPPALPASLANQHLGGDRQAGGHYNGQTDPGSRLSLSDMGD